VLESAFDEASISEALERLSNAARLAFALSCAEQLFPNYSDVIERLRDAVATAAPDTEDFETVYVSSALDAAASAGLVLDYVLEGSTSSIVEIASLCRDTVDMIAQERENMDSSDPKLEERISSHPLMQAELKRQRTDLQSLAAFAGGAGDVEALKKK
jgi:uncharacterized protein YjaG (DUF416 family)